jgi:hypothetical protein
MYRSATDEIMLDIAATAAECCECEVPGNEFIPSDEGGINDDDDDELVVALTGCSSIVIGNDFRKRAKPTTLTRSTNNYFVGRIRFPCFFRLFGGAI